MSHFAKLDENNIVVFVVYGRQEDDGKEKELSERTGETYKQTSYNTHGGIHYNVHTWEPSPDQSRALRKNFAGIGYFYDSVLDGFIPPKPFPSWHLNETTCLWEAPIPYPNDGNLYIWDEQQQAWVDITGGS